MIKLNKNNRGQVMLLTVILLSGTVMGATAIAGMLTIYQLRQSSNVSDSMRALYAADTGIGWELYKNSKDSSYAKPVMTNGAEFETKLSQANTIKSTGFADTNRRVGRAFQVSF